MTLRARPASPADAPDITRIYNEGIEDRLGTFETRLRTEADVRAMVTDYVFGLATPRKEPV